MKKIEVKIIGINNFQTMYKCFEKLNCKIEEIKYSITYSTLLMNVIIQTENKSINVEKEFWKLYDYIGFVLGYYPKIDSATLTEENCNRKINLDNIAEKYKTSNGFILQEAQFIYQIDNDKFKETYNKFKQLREKINFQISVYNVSMMQNNNYPEIRTTNILQALDGLYDNLEITKDSRIIVKDITKIKSLKDKIKNIDLNIFEFDVEEHEIVKKYINDSICRLELINYDTKLKNLFGYLNERFKIFELEKKQTNVEKDYDKFILKCKHTRNQFSHSKKMPGPVFDGKESALYIFKIVLAFRLLIINEIGLGESIDVEDLNKYVELIDNRIVEEIKLEKV